MKKVFIIIMALFAVLSACKKDKLVTVPANITGPELTGPADGTSIQVTADDSAQVLNITWKKANYGVAAVVSYFVQADTAGSNFSKKFVIGGTPNDTLAFTYGALNSKLLAGLGLAPNSPATIEIRVGANIYGTDTVYSKPIQLSFTTFKVLAPDKLYVPGAYQGWDPGAAPAIPETTTYNYEGYVYLSSAGDFKFTSAPDWNHINYGYAGVGMLSTDGLAGDLNEPAAGYYKFNVDIQNLTWSGTLIQSFGIIGTATAGQWNSSTPMTYNPATGLWTVTATLTPGALKFRANDAWDINYGPAEANALTGTLIFNDPGSVTINDAGTYTITLDMTQSAQKAYTYTIVKN